MAERDHLEVVEIKKESHSANLMDKIDLDEIGMKGQIKAEIERHKKFASGLPGIKEQSVKVGDVDTVDSEVTIKMDVFRAACPHQDLNLGPSP